MYRGKGLLILLMAEIIVAVFVEGSGAVVVNTVVLLYLSVKVLSNLERESEHCQQKSSTPL